MAMEDNKNIIFTPVKVVSNKNKIWTFAALTGAIGLLGVTFAANVVSNKSQADKAKQQEKQYQIGTAASVSSSAQTSFNSIPDYIQQIDAQKQSFSGSPDANSKKNLGDQDVNSISNEKQLEAGALIANPEPQKVSQDLKAQEAARAAEDDEIYLGSKKKAPKSPYEVISGTYIPATLETGLDSDLAGYASAVTRQNVFDTVTGTYLLIPKGTRIFGKYENKVAYGQQRLLINWNRLIFSDGSSISIKGMPGTDKEGYSGFHDEVDNHLANLFSGAILLSIIGAGAQLSQPQTASGVTPSPSEAMGQTFAAQTGNQLSSISGQVVQKNMNISPTITIRPGYEFNIVVNRDMILEPISQEN